MLNQHCPASGHKHKTDYMTISSDVPEGVEHAP